MRGHNGSPSSKTGSRTSREKPATRVSVHGGPPPGAVSYPYAAPPRDISHTVASGLIVQNAYFTIPSPGWWSKNRLLETLQERPGPYSRDTTIPLGWVSACRPTDPRNNVPTANRPAHEPPRHRPHETASGSRDQVGPPLTSALVVGAERLRMAKLYTRTASPVQGTHRSMKRRLCDSDRRKHARGRRREASHAGLLCV